MTDLDKIILLSTIILSDLDLGSLIEGENVQAPGGATATRETAAEATKDTSESSAEPIKKLRVFTGWGEISKKYSRQACAPYNESRFRNFYGRLLKSLAAGGTPCQTLWAVDIKYESNEQEYHVRHRVLVDLSSEDAFLETMFSVIMDSSHVDTKIISISTENAHYEV